MAEDEAEKIGEGKGQESEASYPSACYSWYVVGVLTFFYILSFVDRQIIALLVEPMKADLDLSDIEVSLLGGLSFVVFYTLWGIPMGRLADSRSRRGVIAFGVALWSFLTALCGFATRFWQLLLLRMGVGIGEAALSPAAFSLISDYFPKHKLATALSVYSMGVYLGAGLAFTGGALIFTWASRLVETQESLLFPLLGGFHPWQIVFFAVGVPGLLMTLFLGTVKEPVRRGILGQTAIGQAEKIISVPVREVVKYLRQNWQTVACHNLGVASLSLASYSGGFWDVAFLDRTYGWLPEEGGMWYGLVTLVAGAGGVLCGGRFADFLTQKGYPDAKMRAIFIAAVVWLPFGMTYPLMPSAPLSLSLLFPTLFTAAMPFGCAAAAIQEMMPPQIRGQASAIYLFAINIIGLGMGPTAVAFLTEKVFQDGQMLRYSLLCVGGFAHLMAAVFFALSFKPYQRSLEYLKKWGTIS